MTELQSLKPQLLSGLDGYRRWFHGMIDSETGRLCYKYIPDKKEFLKEPSPVRDLGTAADLGTLQAHFSTTEFCEVMQRTLDHFQAALVEEQGWEDGAAEEGEQPAAGREVDSQPWSYLDPMKINEPSSIAHNSMFILALASLQNHPRPEESRQLMTQLADGILHQQRPDGTYKIYFQSGDLGDFGYELYCGEAMLGLLTAHQHLGHERYLTSVQKALPQYERIYRSGSIGRTELVFFANWQTQVAALLARSTTDPKASSHLSAYIYHLHDTILDKLKLYEAVKRFPEKMATVEVGCGLEGLVDAYALALEEGPGAAARQQRYAAAIRTAVDFLQEVQAKSAELGGEVAVGGLGHGLTRPLQRIDVTGHVACAYIRLLEVLEGREP
ncbi:hypothetical protein N2152v2_009224 [Parachlorella kessleri]